MTTEDLVTSLRDLADFYERHPTLPVPYDFESPMFVFLYGKDKDEVRSILREIGSFKKQFDEPSDGSFDALKTIGSIILRFHASRDSVCRRIVVGTRTIPEHIIPAEPERVIPAKEEEIIEWECEPILAEESAHA